MSAGIKEEQALGKSQTDFIALAYIRIEPAGKKMEMVNHCTDFNH